MPANVEIWDCGTVKLLEWLIGGTLPDHNSAARSTTEEMIASITAQRALTVHYFIYAALIYTPETERSNISRTECCSRKVALASLPAGWLR